MKAIILAAGKGTRLYPLTKSKPKCLVKVGKKTLIEHEIDNLIKIGIKNFIILVGPFENQIKSLLLKKYKNVKFNFIKNPKYMTTNYIYSMWLTKKHLQEDKKTKHILLLHGDILFDYDLLELIMKSKQNVVPVNKHMKLPEKDFKARIQNGKVVEIGTKIFEENCYASFPIYKIKKQDFLLWLEEIEQLINEKKINNYAEDALSKQMKLYPLYFKNNFCMEIDNIQDLKIAKKKSFNKVVACYRRYPLPGGRNTLLTFLKERNDIEVINNKDLKSPFKGMKYGLKCFQQLKKLKPDVVLSMGLYGEGALLYSRISNKKGIYNLSGFRFKIYNLFNKKVLSELISMFLCDKIILPSKEAADQIKKYAPIFKKKIEIIYEGAKPIKSKKHTKFNIGIARLEGEKIYEIQKGILNSPKFKKIHVYLIESKEIFHLYDGKSKKLIGKRMKDVLPYLDCLFVLPSSDLDYHSSSILESFEAGIPVFMTRIRFLDQYFFNTVFNVKEINITQIFEKISIFQKNRERLLKKFKKIEDKILKLYNYDLTMSEWERELFL